MRSLAALTSLLVLGVVGLVAGCGRGGHAAPREGEDAGPATPVLPALLPAPRAWSFVRQRGDMGLALPERCQFRGFNARAEVPETTHFVAEARTPATLVVADSAGDPPRLTGVAAVTMEPEGASHDPVALPWFEPSVLPRLARGGGRWVASFEHAGGVALWRGGAAEAIGQGDGFEAVDLACAGARCALLTTRAARVAQPGATVWLGSAEEAASRWKAVELIPGAADSEARPLGLARIEGDGKVSAALLDKGEVVIFEADAAGAHETARLPAPHGALDAVALPRAAAMTFSSALDDDGCARDGHPAVRFVREGQPPVELASPAPPQRG